MARAQLPRVGAAQQPRRHQPLPRLLGRQPGEHRAAVAQGLGAAVCRDDGRLRQDHGQGQGTQRPGQVSRGVGDPEQAGVRATGQPGGEGPAGGRLRATRLPEGKPDAAQHLSAGRLRAAQRPARRHARQVVRTGHDPGDVDRELARLHRHQHRPAQGRWPALHHQPGHARQRREVPDRDEQRDADQHQGRAGEEPGPHHHPQSRRPQPGDDGHEHLRRPDQGRQGEVRRRPQAIRPAARPAGRVRAEFRDPAGNGRRRRRRRA